MNTTEGIKWQGRAVKVTAHLVPRYCWTTASIDVYLDDECILRSGGQMKIVSSYPQVFTHAGAQHTAELSWGVGMFWSFPYTLRIDGAPITQGRVRVRNWPIGLALTIIAGIALGVLVGSMVIVARHISAQLPH